MQKFNKVTYMTKLFIILFLLYTLSTSAAVYKNENYKIVTVCEVSKITYVHIETFDSVYVDKGLKKALTTSFSVDNTPSKETYSLALSNDPITKEVNIFYRSDNYPFLNWNMVEDEKNGKIFCEFKTFTPKNLVIRTWSLQDDRIYYFNLDKDLNGFLSITSTRWESPMDSYNGQSIYFATCKAAT